MSKLNWYFMFFMCTYEMKQSYTKSDFVNSRCANFKQWQFNIEFD